MAVILGDILVLAVTWFKTARLYNEARRQRKNFPLATMLFRDGTLYFVILLTLNILQIIEANVPVLLSMDVSEPFQEVLPSIIICRFILNLRQVKPAGSSWISGSKSGSIRVIDDMGQSLQTIGEEPADEEEDHTTDPLPVNPEESDSPPGTTAPHGEQKINQDDYIYDIEAL
ncbi:hypothetical protein BC629DRAFT_89367 [Irpex lacteus]|nr:hypothetical protein BC629DRAFT_89367 [Irpex lacteus]